MTDKNEQEHLGDSMDRDVSEIKNGAQNLKAAADKVKSMQNATAVGESAAGAGGKGVAIAGNASVTSSGMAASGGSAAASSAAGGATGSAAAGAGSGAATGAAAGAGSGAATGAAAGSAVGPAGTAAGAAVGFLGKPIVKAVGAIIIGTLFLVTALIYSLPFLVFGPDGSSLSTFGTETLAIQDAAVAVITDAYAEVFNTIVAKAADGGYDVDLTLANIIDMSGGATNVDTAYLISAYCVSMKNKNVSSADMINKLKGKADGLYTFSTTVQIGEKIVPVTVDAYESYTITVPETLTSVTKIYYQRDGNIRFDNTSGIYLPAYEEKKVQVLHPNGSVTWETYYDQVGVAFYQAPTTTRIYTYRQVVVTTPTSANTKQETVYRKAGTQQISELTTLPTYEEKEFTVVDTEGNRTKENHLALSGTEDVEPEVIQVEYLKATINPIQKNELNSAFGLDLNGWYTAPLGDNQELGVRNIAAVASMTENFTLLLNDANISTYKSSVGGSSGVPTEIPALTSLMEGLVIPPCSDNRLYMMEIGSALVGRVPYWFGGNHGSNYCPPGWNADWIVTTRQVPSGGKAGQILPYGIDCSGFVKWVYATAFGADQFTPDDYTGTFARNANTRQISASELLPGDIALCDGHTGLFLGYNAAGQKVYMHALNYTKNVLVSTYSEFNVFLRVVGVADQIEGNNLRQQADVLTRLGLSSAANPAVDYSLPQYSWMTAISNPLPTATVGSQVELTIKYYCSCPSCSGIEGKAKTSTGVAYVAGIAASGDLPPGTKIGLFGKVFEVQDTVPNAEPGTIYIYLPQHSLLTVMSPRVVTAPIYS